MTNTTSIETGRDAVISAKAWAGVGGFTLVIALVWLFPTFWYTRGVSGQRYFWLAEQTNAPGWRYESRPLAESAEAVLVADQLVNGEFSRGAQTAVRVFSAKRFVEKQNDIGLFVHTPDRCWTEAGWKMEALEPDVVELSLHGIALQFERRIFSQGQQRELVYFTGLTGGQPLPYRLDHNLSVGRRQQQGAGGASRGAVLRASDARLWRRVWESFWSRRPLLGPKQFLRISTVVHGEDVAEADRLLREFLPRWLQPADYARELEQWKARQKP